jgi:hypothetical protein
MLEKFLSSGVAPSDALQTDGSPTPSGWLKAIKNGFLPLGLAWTRTLSKNISPSHPPPSKAINDSNSKTFGPRHLRKKRRILTNSSELHLPTLY